MSTDMDKIQCKDFFLQELTNTPIILVGILKNKGIGMRAITWNACGDIANPVTTSDPCELGNRLFSTHGSAMSEEE